MKRALFLLAFAAFLVTSGAVDAASGLSIALVPDKSNPTAPEMGNWLKFNSIIKNTGDTPLAGLVVWISLVQVDSGHEQPVDLEDWSAHKALVIPNLNPGQAIGADWAMRLIQAGDYRVVLSATERHAATLYVSPFADFHVRRKPTVESGRILPVAVGMPLLLAGFAAWRMRRGR
ncbi:MAG TPA: hypothetical protein VMV75_00800 [Sulfuricella sp.]|nr:hypothetical protein [Sulfuricella sp.]